MGQIISFIQKRLLGQFFYYIKKCFCRQREEREESEDPNEHSSRQISPELIYPLSDSETDSSFRLHQNVTTKCIDIVEENRQDSAYVLNVANLEELLDPSSSDSEIDSRFRLHQNVTTKCIDIVEENRQDSAYVLNVDNLEELLDPSSSDSEIDSRFRLHQNVTTKCIDILEENRQDWAYVLNVDNLEEREVRGPERWIRHYCSSHKMLLVGEGDFSFSASLAKAFGSATNMVATSLDSRGFLLRNYKKAMSNIHELRTRGCLVLHGVDATKMANHCSLRGIKFDRVIYNFPHAGFRSGESGTSQIRRHQLLLSLFFKNAKQMIDESGEIHVTHKSNGFFLGWNLQGLASAVGLRLIQEVPFNYTDYPGYRTKYGFGGDKNFNSKPSKTYKFGLFPTTSP